MLPPAGTQKIGAPLVWPKRNIISVDEKGELQA
jgi:hypothetical protein